MVVDTATWTIKKEIQGIGPDLQTPAITYDGKYVLCPFSGFQRLSSGIAWRCKSRTARGAYAAAGGGGDLQRRDFHRRRLVRSIEFSMAVGFTRLGADMLVVPAGALTNITAALLTAEPTDLTLDDGVLARLEALKGVQKAVPQLIFRSDASGYRGGGDLVDVIAFDPARDITVQPLAGATSRSPD